jgi:hypothetical protein
VAAFGSSDRSEAAWRFRAGVRRRSLPRNAIGRAARMRSRADPGPQNQSSFRVCAARNASFEYA